MCPCNLFGSLLIYFAAHAEIKSLEFFGTIHEDERDEMGAMTSVCCANDLPEGYHPGIFGFPEVMVYFLMDPDENGVACIIFSCLHLHGGTTPYPKDGTEWLWWAYRFLQVNYPPSGLFSCDGERGPRFRLSNSEKEFDALRPEHQLVT